MTDSNTTEVIVEAAEQVGMKPEDFIQKYRKQILAVVGAIILVVTGYFVFNTAFMEPREQKASTALAKAQEMFMQGDFQKALNGDKGVEGFVAIQDNYSFTDAANLARLYAGLCYANLGKWQEAVKCLDDFSTKGDQMISPAATAALGDAYANTGEIDKAISAFKKAADMADSKAKDGVNNSLSPTFLIKAGRLLESQNKQEDALAIYEKIKEKYVESPVSQDIDKYIERCKK